MSSPSAPPVTAEQAQLYREAERLTEEFCARVRAGEDGGGEELFRRREELLRRIREMGEPAHPRSHGGGEMEKSSRESAEAIQRMIDLDRELLTVLQDRKTRIRGQLAEIGRRRQSLESYRGPTPISPAFLDRRS